MSEDFWGNTPSHFRIGLPNHIDFTGGDYECALMEFTCSTKNFPNNMPLTEIYICMNVIGEHITDANRGCNLLRYVVIKWGKFQNTIFPVPYYVRVKTVRTNMLEVYIKDDEGAEVSFLEGKTTCTLHFRRRK